MQRGYPIDSVTESSKLEIFTKVCVPRYRSMQSHIPNNIYGTELCVNNSRMVNDMTRSFSIRSGMSDTLAQKSFVNMAITRRVWLMIAKLGRK